MSWISRISELFQPQFRSPVMSESARVATLALLERNGLRAHYYLPAVGMEDEQLANACRILASAGYIITTDDGTIVGKVGALQPTRDEQIAMRRAAFKLVSSE